MTKNFSKIGIFISTLVIILVVINEETSEVIPTKIVGAEESERLNILIDYGIPYEEAVAILDDFVEANVD